MPAPCTTTKSLPAIIAPRLRKGEHWAGIILDKNGKPDYHLIGVAGKIDAATWNDAMAWAQKHNGELPNRRELGLERVNARRHFKDDWYWSCEQYAGVKSYTWAWCQSFYTGTQNPFRKHNKLRARAVRRVAI